jgi:Na+-translocating ferredoxin:NAD+ oxidoreductase RnfG subunit
MSKVIIVILAAICVLLSGIAYTSEQYICTADKATGFSYNKSLKQWQSTHFKTDTKYIISMSDNKSLAEFVVRKVGDSEPTIYCKDSFNEAGYLHCEDITTFKFNRKNGRYISVNLLGYFNVIPGLNKITDENSDTPYLEIGKCSPF